MRYLVVTMGRHDRGPFAKAVERYRARVDAFAGGCELRSLKASRAATAVERRRADTAALLSAARGTAGYSVLVDERGRRFTTRTLARHVSALEQRGEGRLTLLVGAADGVDPGLRDQVDACWSLSTLTLSHELALAVLLEQLYRVTSMAHGHPYHRA